MCCFLATLVLLGPRVAILVWWLINPMRFSAAFNTFILPILGIIFIPWTTLMYLVVWDPIAGIYGLDWLWLGIGLIADISMHAGGAYGNRDKIPGYGSEPQTIEKTPPPAEPAPPAPPAEAAPPAEEPPASPDDSAPSA